MQHEPERDDATAQEIAKRDWKEKWPHYVRVHHAELIAGSLSDGVSLRELMNAFEADSFASTQRNAATGKGNTNPRMAIRQQAAVELTARAANWLNDQLEAAFERHGRLSPSTMEQLDWPELSSGVSGSAT